MKANESKSEKLVPKRITSILEAYMRTKKRQKKNDDIRSPIVTLLLETGHQLYGKILNCEFSTGRVSFLLMNEQASMDVTFLDMGQIAAMTLHDLELCEEFMEELSVSD
jgi:hypothetical protein